MGVDVDSFVVRPDFAWDKRVTGFGGEAGGKGCDEEDAEECVFHGQGLMLGHGILRRNLVFVQRVACVIFNSRSIVMPSPASAIAPRSFRHNAACIGCR